MSTVSMHQEKRKQAALKPNRIHPRRPAYVRMTLSDREWAEQQRAVYAERKAIARVERDYRRAHAQQSASEKRAELKDAKARLRAYYDQHSATPGFNMSWYGWLKRMARVIDDAQLVLTHERQRDLIEHRVGTALAIKAKIETRLERGFEWSGGGVAGNADYKRPAFSFRGLVSPQHPVLEAFVARTRRAKHLRSGSTKAESSSIGSKVLALDEPYIEDNNVVCGMLRVEIDAAVTPGDVEDACMASDVPPPNLVVGWHDSDGCYRNPHLIWLLHHPIPIAGESNRGNLALWQGVCRGLTKALLCLGADPGGLSNAHRHKNPCSPLWNRCVIGQQPYHLDALAADVDTRVSLEKLAELASEIQGCPRSAVADHPHAEVATSSNRLFRSLAAWARSHVVAAKEDGDEQMFAADVLQEAVKLAVDLVGDEGHSRRSVAAVARTVAKWTWNVYRAPKPAEKLSADERAARIREGQLKGAETKSDVTWRLLLEGADRVLAAGGKLRQVAVVEAVKAAGGSVSERTVRNHWSALTAHFEARQQSPGKLAPAVPAPSKPIKLPGIPKPLTWMSETTWLRGRPAFPTLPRKTVVAPVVFDPYYEGR